MAGPQVYTGGVASNNKPVAGRLAELTSGPEG
jgi:hypothetical protein